MLKSVNESLKYFNGAAAPAAALRAILQVHCSASGERGGTPANGRFKKQFIREDLRFVCGERCYRQSRGAI